MNDDNFNVGNDEELLNIFFEESRDQLDVLDQGLVHLETSAGDKELIQAIFRAAHTLKSSAAAMGFYRMSDLTHAMEDVLDRIREGTLGVTPDIVDPLLGGVDCLREMESSLINGGSDGLSDNRDAAIAKALRSVGTSAAPVISGGAVAAQETAAAAEPESGYENDPTALIVSVSLAQDCLMPSMRAFMVFREAGKYGRILETNPGPEQIDSNDVGLELFLTLADCSDAEALRRAIQRVAEVETVDVMDPAGESGVEPKVTDSYDIESVMVTGSDFFDESDIAADPVVTVATPGASAASSGQSRASVPTAPVPPADVPPGVGGVVAPRDTAVTNELKQQSVRVNVDTLDQILNLVGELVLNRSRVLQIKAMLEEIHPNDETVRDLDAVTQQLGSVVGELHTRVLEARMLPVKMLYTRFPRMVRDICRSLGKEVDFIAEGENELLDRSVMERLVDPITHILRNALDHGMETPDERVAAGKPRSGTVRLSTRRRDENIEISITDDGPGINSKKVLEKAVANGLVSPDRAAVMTDHDIRQLIFASGLSTAKAVSEVSGRGVGMDVVKRELDAIGGIVLVESVPGHGSTFTLTIPLTLAILRALIVRVGETDVAVPLAVAEETLKVDPAELHTVGGNTVMKWREQVVPVVTMRNVMAGCGDAEESKDRLPVVVVRYASRIIALSVEAVMGHQEIVVKPLGSYIGDIPGVGGATILGNGRIALILDIGSLFNGGFIPSLSNIQ